MSRIKPFKIEFIDPKTMKLVDTQDGNIQVFVDKKGNLSAFLLDDEFINGMKQLLIKKVDD